MDETSTELTIETDPQSNLTDLLEAKLPQHAEQVLFRVQDEPGSGTWREVSAREFREEVIALARGLIAEGIEPGDRVAFLTPNLPEELFAHFAVPLAGFGKAFDGPAMDPKVLEEQQKKLQAELEKRSEDMRKKLEQQGGAAGAAPAAGAAAPAAKRGSQSSSRTTTTRRTS